MFPPLVQLLTVCAWLYLFKYYCYSSTLLQTVSLKACMLCVGKDMLFEVLNCLPDDQKIAMQSNISNACSHFSVEQWAKMLEDDQLHEMKAAFDGWLANLGVGCRDVQSIFTQITNVQTSHTDTPLDSIHFVAATPLPKRNGDLPQADQLLLWTETAPPDDEAPGVWVEVGQPCKVPAKKCIAVQLQYLPCGGSTHALDNGAAPQQPTPMTHGVHISDGQHLTMIADIVRESLKVSVLLLCLHREQQSVPWLNLCLDIGVGWWTKKHQHVKHLHNVEHMP